MLRLFIFVVCASALLAQDGSNIYRSRCARCHDAPVGRTPAVNSLRAMRPAAILATLDNGAMKMQAAGLTEPERKAVSDYLGTAESPRESAPSNACELKESDPLQPNTGPAWSNWGVDSENRRFQSSESAALDPHQVPKLKLKWAFGLGQAAAPRSQPAVAFGRIFVGADAGEVYSLDARSGCTHWVFRADAPVRSGMVVDVKQQTVFFGDGHANVYCLRAGNGRLLWKKHVDDNFAAMITAAPALHEEMLYVAVSSFEEVMAASPKYACCTFRGSVVALNALTGEQIWKTYTTGETTPAQHGPSGAAVWSTPNLRREAKLVVRRNG